MAWLLALATSIGLVDAALFGVRKKDWRVLAATLLAGGVGVIVGGVAAVSSESASEFLPLYAGGVAVVISALWWRAHPRSWHRAWDELIGAMGHVQMVVSYLVILLALLVGVLLLLR